MYEYVKNYPVLLCSCKLHLKLRYQWLYFEPFEQRLRSSGPVFSQSENEYTSTERLPFMLTPSKRSDDCQFWHINQIHWELRTLFGHVQWAVTACIGYVWRWKCISNRDSWPAMLFIYICTLYNDWSLPRNPCTRSVCFTICGHFSLHFREAVFLVFLPSRSRKWLIRCS